MEAVLIDSTVLSMLNGHELVLDDFYTPEGERGVFLSKEAFRKYIRKLDTKFRTQNRYLSYVGESTSFRKAMDLQVAQLVKAVENGDATIYEPVVIR